jgi:hypothetical protein
LICAFPGDGLPLGGAIPLVWGPVAGAAPLGAAAGVTGTTGKL